MNEKRNFKRRHLIFYLRVFNNNAEQPFGYIVDITPQGCMVISEKEIEAGKKMTLRMDLPSGHGGKKHLVLKAETKWCKPDVNPDFFDIGFRFDDIDYEDEEIVHSLINMFGFQD